MLRRVVIAGTTPVKIDPDRAGVPRKFTVPSPTQNTNFPHSSCDMFTLISLAEKLHHGLTAVTDTWKALR